VQLDAANRCLIFGRPERPAVCLAFRTDREICGDTNAQALQQLQWLEQVTVSVVNIG
jgi:uncharacterized protein